MCATNYAKEQQIERLRQRQRWCTLATTTAASATNCKALNLNINRQIKKVNQQTTLKIRRATAANARKEQISIGFNCHNVEAFYIYLHVEGGGGRNAVRISMPPALRPLILTHAHTHTHIQALLARALSLSLFLVLLPKFRPLVAVRQEQ